jgi:hypothetical protein
MEKLPTQLSFFYEIGKNCLLGTENCSNMLFILWVDGTGQGRTTKET